jgi:hypothetical protein
VILTRSASCLALVTPDRGSSCPDATSGVGLPTIGLRGSASVAAALAAETSIAPLSCIKTGPQPRRRLLLAPGIVAGTGLGCGGSSVPGPMASPGRWTVRAGNNHRRTEERRRPCPRYRRPGQRPSRRGGVATGASAPSLARSTGKSAWQSSAVTSTQEIVGGSAGGPSGSHQPPGSTAA